MRTFLAAFFSLVLQMDGSVHLKPGYCAPGETGPLMPAVYLDRSFSRDYAREMQTNNCAIAFRAMRIRLTETAPN